MLLFYLLVCEILSWALPPWLYVTVLVKNIHNALPGFQLHNSNPKFLKIYQWKFYGMFFSVLKVYMSYWLQNKMIAGWPRVVFLSTLQWFCTVLPLQKSNNNNVHIGWLLVTLRLHKQHLTAFSKDNWTRDF